MHQLHLLEVCSALEERARTYQSERDAAEVISAGYVASPTTRRVYQQLKSFPTRYTPTFIVQHDVPQLRCSREAAARDVDQPSPGASGLRNPADDG